MLSRIGRVLPRFGRRNFSKYMEDQYGLQYHRLANRPGIQIDNKEVFAYVLGGIILLTDISRDQRAHRKMFAENGCPDEVWNQKIWLDGDSMITRRGVRSISMGA